MKTVFAVGYKQVSWNDYYPVVNSFGRRDEDGITHFDDGGYFDNELRYCERVTIAECILGDPVMVMD